MNKSIKELLSKSGYIKRNGATAESIALAERLLKTTFSKEYKELLLWSNGGDFFEGGIELFAINDPTCPTHLLIGFINSPQRRPESIPKQYIIIGATIFGDYICLTHGGSIVQLLNAKRTSAVLEAWRNEKLLVEDGKCSRQWSQSEIAELKSKGYISGYYGHHMQSVKQKPTQAVNPDNIQFLSYDEHINGAHAGSTHNPTNGYYDVRTKTMHNFESERPHKPIFILDNSVGSNQTHTNEKSIRNKSSNQIKY